MNSITTKNYAIHFNTKCYSQLNAYLKQHNFSKIFVLVDTNTHEYCAPILLSHLEFEVDIIEITPGEEHKTIETCSQIWASLSDLGADRNSLLINLGGGVVTDIGGFIASCFKRGIQFINIPTTLLAMVDASIGGKTGVDLNGLKNQIGTITFSDMVLVDPQFLNTLPANQMRSGLAEMLKHGLIKDEIYWNKLINLNALTLNDLDELIYQSILIKKEIVEIDPTEKGIRKTLNYGHTLGHAIETYFLESQTKTTLLHGEAIAIGMIMETYISNKLLNFPTKKMNAIKKAILNTYGRVEIEKKDYNPILDYLKFDKKNSHGNINFVLLKDIGKATIDYNVKNDVLLEAFGYYLS